MEGCGECQLIMSFHLGLNVIKPASPSSSGPILLPIQDEDDGDDNAKDLDVGRTPATDPFNAFWTIIR